MYHTGWSQQHHVHQYLPNDSSGTWRTFHTHATERDHMTLILSSDWCSDSTSRCDSGHLTAECYNLLQQTSAHTEIHITHTHARTRTHVLTHTNTHTHTHTHTLTDTHARTHTHTHTHTHTQTHSCSLTHTHARSLTHRHTHTHSLTHTHTRQPKQKIEERKTALTFPADDSQQTERERHDVLNERND